MLRQCFPQGPLGFTPPAKSEWLRRFLPAGPFRVYAAAKTSYANTDDAYADDGNGDDDGFERGVVCFYGACSRHFYDNDYDLLPITNAIMTMLCY